MITRIQELEDSLALSNAARDALAAELAQSEKYRANLAQGYVDQADRIRALEADLHNANLAATQNKELGDHHFQRARALEAELAEFKRHVPLKGGIPLKQFVLETQLAEVVEFMKLRCIGVCQTADAARWVLIRKYAPQSETPVCTCGPAHMAWEPHYSKCPTENRSAVK